MGHLKKIIVVLCVACAVSFFFKPQIVTGARLSGDQPSVSPASGDRQNGALQKGPAPEPVQASEEKPVKKAVKARENKAHAERSARTKIKKAAAAQEPANGNHKPHEKKGEYVTIDFDNVDIAVFIKTIGEMTGKNFVIDNQVKGNVSVYSPRKITVNEAYKVFESVLEVHGYTTVPAGDIVKIVPAKDAKEKNIETRLKNEASGPEDKIITQIVSLNHANPDDMKRILDPLISRASLILSYPPTGMLVITDVHSNVRRLLAIIGALDVPGSGEQITLIPLKNANAQDVAKALNAVFQAEQAQRRGAAHVIKVLPDDRTNTIIVMATEFYTARVRELIGLLDREVPRGESTMHVYRLQNANAEDLAKVLMSLPQKEAGKGGPQEKGKAPTISKEVQVLADKATNTLIISAARDDYRVLEDVIKSLDVSRAMVYLEALIMEVSVNKSFKLGVEWRGMAKTASSTGIFAGSGGLSDQTNPGGYSIIPDVGLAEVAGAAAATAAFPQGFAFGILNSGINIGGVQFPTIGAALQAIQQDQDIHILSTPQILTMDNEDAEIRVGQNVPYLTRQDTTGVTGIAYSNYEYRDVGVLLKVTPHINEDGFVRMKIGQEVTQIVSQSSGLKDASAPTTLKRTANTTVIVKDNSTVVIGGIIGDSSTHTNYQVPCLGSMPLLGNLFKSRSNTGEKTNLFVFLTPRIVRTQQDAAGIYQEKRGSMGEVKEGVIKLQKQSFPLPPKEPAEAARPGQPGR